MRLRIDAFLDYAFAEPADVLLQIEAAATADQRLVHQSLVIGSDHPIRALPGPDGVGQVTLARGEGRLTASYAAIVDIAREPVALEALPATPPRDLPADALGYLLPSRYCEVTPFEHFVRREFPGLEGGPLATALAEWVRASVDYGPPASGPGGSALVTFAERRGVCRDFAHLLVSLARAGGIPARCVAAYAPGVDPPDFHAVAELWLAGAWRLVDPTGMARADEIARVVVGRDATDIAFLTIFGEAQMVAQRVSVRREGQERRRSATVVDPQQRRSPVTAEPGIDPAASDSLAVAPVEGVDDKLAADGRQEAGQDKSIAKRLEKNPGSEDARLDNALDESMDASDPPAQTQPGADLGPAPSSGFDEEAERQQDS